VNGLAENACTYQDATPRPPIVWVWHDVPARLGSGSQQQASQVLAALAEFFTVHIVVIRGDRGFTDLVVGDTGCTCHSIHEVRESEAPAAVVRVQAETSAVAVVLFDFTTAIVLRAVLPALGLVYIDLDELLSKRQQRFLNTPGLAPNLHDGMKRRLKMFQVLERKLLPVFQEFLVSSEIEKQNLGGLVPPSMISVVPNATWRQSPLPPADPLTVRTIMFVGRMDYFPNLDAMAFFLREIWPRLRARYGEQLRFHLVGSYAPSSFRPETLPGIAYSPRCKDVIPAYREASLVVVPLRSGGGTRVKILEAFALGRPVVSTSIGAEGLEVEPGQQLLIADDPEAFAEACISILEDPGRSAALAREALAFVRAHHSPDAVQRAIRACSLIRNHV
jgi:glycosyltransferase involved in cell wall biosynthesis